MVCEKASFFGSTARQKNQEDLSIVSLLKTCTSVNNLERGRRAHATAIQTDSLGQNAFIGSALVNMYAKCGAMAASRRVFEDLTIRNVVCWNALIMGFAQRGLGEEAISFFKAMRQEGLVPNAVTYLGILKACAAIGAAEEGRTVHEEIARFGLLDKNILLGTALVDMYIKCSALARAQEVFDELPVQNFISWTVLITGYCHHGYGLKALICFDRMCLMGLSPDAVTFTCILKVCGSIGAREKGVQVHKEILRNGMLGKDNVLCTALADMYIKCGQLSKAEQVFARLTVLDVVSWNSLIAGYCEHGHCVEALECVDKMQRKGLSPDAATFASILKVCGSSGVEEKGQFYFETMSQNYGVVPRADHYTSIADLFGRAGQFDKALNAIAGVPFWDYPPLWMSLLGACQRWGNCKVGGLAFEHALEFQNSTVGGVDVMTMIRTKPMSSSNATL